MKSPCFGRALIPVILSYGKCFEKTGTSRVSFALPGEIIRNEVYEKVLFTVSMDRYTREIFHVYATHKTPLQLISEFAKDGCFEMDEEGIAKAFAAFSAQKAKKESGPLDDDGSRITEVNPDFMSVVMADKTILTVFPFPEMYT